MLRYGPDELATAVLALYASLNFKPPPNQFTILAAFVLSNAASGVFKVISLGTGSKCLPAMRLTHGGDALHDSHAEVVARRGAVRWLLEEVQRVKTSGTRSAWLVEASDARFRLADDVRVHLYVSTVPCGDASTRYLAALQDLEMAALKDSGERPVLENGTARGRNGYSLYGVLRTKPGRADSPPTLSMSCSDKIASWCVLGIQGALASRFLHTVYIANIIIGEVDAFMRHTVQQDCDRAFFERLSDIVLLPKEFSLRQPSLAFTSIPFIHSRSVLDVSSSCNDSLCWVADSQRPHEVVINGLKRGVPPKHRHNPKFRSLLSKIALFGLYANVAELYGTPLSKQVTYQEAKHASSDYQDAKMALQGPNGPFRGWVKTGAEWERFDSDGTLAAVASEHNKNF